MENRYNDPRYTIALMGMLNLSNEEHRALHHRKTSGISVKSHIKYCSGITRFPEGSNNAQFAQKLERLLLDRIYQKACEKK